MDDALEHIDEIVAWMNQGRPVLLLDFDGTLAPIVDRPEEAGISRQMRRIVERLAQDHPVAVISGRELADVRQRVGLSNVAYAGSHGFEIQRPDHSSVSVDKAADYLDRVDEAESRLRERLEAKPGVQLERKRYGIAVHYRRADQQTAQEARAQVERILEEIEGLEVTQGKAVLDVRPELDWDKGNAVEWLLENLYGRQARPVFLGDDTTDEDAFCALVDRGIGIRVGQEEVPTAADYRLEDVQAVETFLEYLFDRLRAG